MNSVRAYLPSAKFATLVGSLLLAGGLVYGAERIIAPPASPTSTIATSQSASTDDTDWQQSLYLLEGETGSTSIPQPPDQTAVDQSLNEVQTANLTDSVGRSLLVDLTNAKSQGLGDDAPTQDEILQDAAGQIDESQSITYSAQQLTIVDNSNQSLRTYGDDMMTVLLAHPNASAATVLAATQVAINSSNTYPLQHQLPGIAKEYTVLAQALLSVPVPESLAPLHLQIINNLEGMGESIPGIEMLLSDPLRGATALQQFNTLLTQEQNSFTTVAQEFQRNNILFSTNESGYMWNAYLTPSS